jgi:Cu/Ag efflux protein CusF
MKWFPWLTTVFLAAALALGWVGCKPAAPATATGASSAEETPREYSVRGVVRRVEPERRSVVVKHEEIPGFMPAMTMPFDVKSRCSSLSNERTQFSRDAAGGPPASGVVAPARRVLELTLPLCRSGGPQE